MKKIKLFFFLVSIFISFDAFSENIFVCPINNYSNNLFWSTTELKYGTLYQGSLFGTGYSLSYCSTPTYRTDSSNGGSPTFTAQCPLGYAPDTNNICQQSTCPSGQIGTPPNCTQPPTCESGQYNAGELAICTTIPDCNAESPASGKFFNVLSGECETTTVPPEKQCQSRDYQSLALYSLLTDTYSQLTPTRVYCPPMDACIDVWSQVPPGQTNPICTNGTLDISAYKLKTDEQHAAIVAQLPDLIVTSENNIEQASEALEVHMVNATLAQQKYAADLGISLVKEGKTAQQQVTEEQQAIASQAISNNAVNMAQNAQSAYDRVLQLNDFVVTPQTATASSSATIPGNDQVARDAVAIAVAKQAVAKQDVITGQGIGFGPGQAVPTTQDLIPPPNYNYPVGSSQPPNPGTSPLPVNVAISASPNQGSGSGTGQGTSSNVSLGPLNLPEVPTIEQSMNNLMLGLQNMEIMQEIGQLQNLTFPTVTQCPIQLSIDLTSINMGNHSTNVICDLLEYARPVIQLTAVLAYSMTAIFIIFSA